MRNLIVIAISCSLAAGCFTWAHPVNSKRYQALEPSSRAEVLKNHLNNAQTGPQSQRVLVDVAESYLEQTRAMAQRSAETGQAPDPYAVAYLAEQAAATYSVLADTYPDWPPRPQALWYLGLLLEQIESKEESKRWWDTLLERYPQSDEAAQVRVLRGRRALREAQDDKLAIQWLTPVAKRSDIHGATAHYWLAWAQTNLGHTDKALKHFLTAAKATRAENPPLHRQAVLDSIVPFSLEYPNRSGLNVYEKLSADRGIYAAAVKKLESRARTLANRPVDLVVVREMARLDTDALNNDQRVTYLYKAHVETEFKYLEQDDVTLFAQVHRSQALAPTSVDDVDESYDDMIFDLCMRLHDNWEVKKDPKTASGVASAWQQYVHHPRRVEHRPMAYQNMARLYDIAQRPFASAQAWSQLADLSEGTSAVVAHRESVARYLKQFGKERDKRSPVAWQSLSGLMRHLEPIEQNASSRIAAKVMYRVARAHQAAQAHNVAESVYRRLAENHPRTEQAVAGVQALLAIQNLKGDSDAFGQTITWLKGTEVSDHPQIRTEIARLAPAVREKQTAERLAKARQQGPEAMEALLARTDDPALRSRMQVGLIEKHAHNGSLEDASKALTAALSAQEAGDGVYVAVTTLAQQHFLRGQVEEGVEVLQQARRQGSPEAFVRYVNQWTDALRGADEAQPADSPSWTSAKSQSQAFARLLKSSGDMPLQSVVAEYGPVRDALLIAAQQGTEEEAVKALSALMRLTSRLGERVQSWPAPAGLGADQEVIYRKALAEHGQGILDQAKQFEGECVSLVQSRQIMSKSALSCVGRAPSEWVRPKFVRIAPGAVARKRLLKTPGSANDLAALAQELADSGRSILALRLIELGLSESPQNGALHRVRGDIHWKRGERAVASDHWGTAARAGDVVAQDNVQRIATALLPKTAKKEQSAQRP